LIGMVMVCIISCYRQVVAILELTKMFDDRKSCETVVISKSFVLFVSLAMIIVATLMILNYVVLL